MTHPITVYGHDFCPMVPVLRYTLDNAQVDYLYVDIKKDAAGCERVKQINHGNASVPTLVFADGSHLTEPSMIDVRAKLKQFGIEVASPSPTDKFKLFSMLLGWKKTNNE